MKDLIFATHNDHKASEIDQILEDYQVKSLKEMGYTQEIVENGSTLQENALIKAKTIFKAFQQPCFADDTGLEVRALRGKPGVYSARYAGENATSEENIEKLLNALEEEPDRKAQFRTVIAYIDEQKEIHLFEGLVQGEILKRTSGSGGFGYDPVFRPKGYQVSFAEMRPNEKNRISHRGLAVKKFVNYLNGQTS